jgi:hypothetical protein
MACAVMRNQTCDGAEQTRRYKRKDAETYEHIKGQLADLERRGDPRPSLNLAGMAWFESLRSSQARPQGQSVARLESKP